MTVDPTDGTIFFTTDDGKVTKLASDGTLTTIIDGQSLLGPVTTVEDTVRWATTDGIYHRNKDGTQVTYGDVVLEQTGVVGLAKYEFATPNEVDGISYTNGMWMNNQLMDGLDNAHDLSQDGLTWATSNQVVYYGISAPESACPQFPAMFDLKTVYYVASGCGGQSSEIKRASFDMDNRVYLNSDSVLKVGGVTSLTTLSQKAIFYASNGSIYQLIPDGTSTELAHGLKTPSNLVVNSATLYWVDGRSIYQVALSL